MSQSDLEAYVAQSLRLRALYRRAALSYTDASAAPYEAEIAYVEADLAAMSLTDAECVEAQRHIAIGVVPCNPFAAP